MTAFGISKTTGSTSQNVGYKVYSAIVNQSGTDDPVATVLQNTLGVNITWSYSDQGSYLGTIGLLGVTDINTLCFVNGYNAAVSTSQYETLFGVGGADSVYLATYKLTEQDGGGNLRKTPTNGVLFNAQIKLEFYG